MSDLRNQDREIPNNTVIDPPKPRSGNSFLSFALGMMFMAVIVLGGAVAYLLSQRNLLPVQPDETSNATPPASVEEPPANNDSSETPQPDNLSSQSTVTSLPSESKPLNLQVNHPNGTVMRVTGVAFADDSTTIELAVTNGSKSEIELNQINNSMILTDNLGSQYNLSPPANNPSLTIKSGTSLKGKFVFLGRLNPSATAITLTTNHKFGGDKDYSRDPKMQVEIPINSR